MEPLHSHRRAALTDLSARREAVRGFTLIELMVVLAIMVVIMSIVLTSQSSFNKTLILSNTAYDIALSLRSVESFGLGSRVVGGVANTGYGIDFQKATPTVFTLFADTDPAASASNCHGLPAVGGASAPDAQPGDCVYGSGDRKVNVYTLGNGITISDMCALSGAAWSCGLSSLDIVFARPNPTPFIRANGSTVTPYSMACLTLFSAQGGSRFITISSSGEINANAASDPASCHG